MMAQPGLQQRWRAGALGRRDDVRGEREKRGWAGLFLRRDDAEGRETQGHQRCDDNDDDAHRYLRHTFVRLGELSASESAIRRQVNGNDNSVVQSRGIWVPTVKYLPEMCRKFVVLAAELVPPGWRGARKRQGVRGIDAARDGAGHDIPRERAEIG